MDLYYQNETLYIELSNNLNEQDYIALRRRIFRIIDDYGVDRVVIKNHRPIFYNRHFLNQIKQDFYHNYSGDFLIK